MTVLGDGGFATAALCWECLRLKISLVSRLRIDCRLYDFPAERLPGTKGRPTKKGNKLMSFKDMLKVEGLPWAVAVLYGVQGNGYESGKSKRRKG